MYQMYGMINWNMTEVFGNLTDELFMTAAKAFLRCREHNLHPNTTAGFHSKYCAIWALLRTARVTLKLPWYYEPQTMKRYLTVFCVGEGDLNIVGKLIDKAKNDKAELRPLSLYHENIGSEIMELELFAEYRTYQTVCEPIRCKVCQYEHLKRCCNMYDSLLDSWTFTDEHLQGLQILYQMMLLQMSSCHAMDNHSNGCPKEEYESDVMI